MKLYQLKKKPSYILIASILISISIFLSGCGGTMFNGWPGVSENQDIVYLSYQGAVYAVNSETGSLVWQFPKDKPNPSKPFFAAPAFGPDGLVVVGNFGNTLYALDANGVEKWQFTITSGNFAASPLVIDDLILVPASNNFLYTLDLNGKKVWEFKTGSVLWAQPVSDGDLVYLSGMDHILYALQLSNGDEVWRKEFDSALISSPVLSGNGELYVATLEGEIFSIDLTSQNVVWSMSTEGRVWSSPVLHDNVLYVGNGNNKALAISTADGNVIWQQDLGSPIIGGAVVLPDGVAFATEAGNLVAWDFTGENQQWTKPIGGKLFTTPVIAGDRLVAAVVEGDNLLKAFTLNGQDSWVFTTPK